MADYFRLDKSRSRIKNLEYRKDEILLDFEFNDKIKDEIKAMCESPRWNPANKCWSVKNSHRSKFAIDFLLGKPVFARYDAPLIPFTPNRDESYNHQRGIMAHMFQRQMAIVAAEMGAGKTLAAIEVLEYLKKLLGRFECWYVAPRVALLSVRLDFAKWKAGYYPIFMTYQEMVKRAKAWKPGEPAPKVIILDESSRAKSPDSQTSKCALHLANSMRDTYGDECWILEMSGSPAPKSPLDWWMQCEIARPGFIREGHPQKFLDRVALVKKVAGESGVAFPKIITFRDSIQKCDVCGKPQDHEIHKCDTMTRMIYRPGESQDTQLHNFKPMVNEVEGLYRRLDGLVTVVFKKDCLDLPEKVYRKINLPPSKYMKSMAKMVAKTAPSVAQGMILLRELSDGFQYVEELVGTRDCKDCMVDGKSTGKIKMYKEAPEGSTSPEYEEVECIHCSGKKTFKVYEQKTVKTDTPKTQALIDILEEKEEDGRIIIFASFQGTIDDVCATVIKSGWNFMRRDGRGWHSDLPTKDPMSLIRQFQREEACGGDRVAFVAHPKSAGMGLTLTASDTIVYYSNSFDAEDRIQSEDRVHRPGCRGANIIDLCHLPIDDFVLENLTRKRNLQSITMGELQRAMESGDTDE